MVMSCLNPEHPDSYYAASAPAVERRPALAGRETANVCIVGAGFTGVSAALHLAERGYSVGGAGGGAGGMGRERTQRRPGRQRHARSR